MSACGRDLGMNAGGSNRSGKETAKSGNDQGGEGIKPQGEGFGR